MHRIATIEKRLWPDACREAGVTSSTNPKRDALNGKEVRLVKVPQITGGRAVSGHVTRHSVYAAGEWSIRRLVDDVKALDTIAGHLGAHGVFVERAGPQRGELSIVWSNPWPHVMRWLPPERTDATKLVIGWDQMGRAVTFPVVGMHCLAGGSTGSGKTGFLQALIGGYACLDHVGLVLLDPKRTEFAEWDARASVRATTPAAMVRALAAVVLEMYRRFETIDARRRVDPTRPKKVTRPSASMPVLVVVVDEIADIVGIRIGDHLHDTTLGALNAAGVHVSDKSTARELIWILAHLARSVGIVVVAATQFPSVKLVPGELRGNLLVRWCGRTEGNNQTGVILGADNQTIPADELPVERGEAFLQIEDQPGIPKIKTVYLDEHDGLLVSRTTARMGLQPSLPWLGDLELPATGDEDTGMSTPEAEAIEAAEPDWDTALNAARAHIAALLDVDPGTLNSYNAVRDAVGVATERLRSASTHDRKTATAHFGVLLDRYRRGVAGG